MALTHSHQPSRGESTNGTRPTETDRRIVGPSFGTTVEPPLSSWQAAAKPWPFDSGRPADLLALVNTNASRLSTGSLSSSDAPLWVTGHQAWLWHPGILAKDMASAAAAKQFGGDVIHLVVDHDIHDALHMQLPVQRGSELHIHDLTLALTRADIPSACQPPVAMGDALVKLKATREQLGDSLKARLDSLEAALIHMNESDAGDLPTAFETLGQQMATLTAKLLAPWTGPLPVLLTSQLCELAGFSQIVQDMLDDAVHCAQTYNHAVLVHPQAGIGPLAVDRQFIELPLWLLNWQSRRQPVYADVTDSVPMLVTADGSPVPVAALPSSQTQKDARGPRLAPRAMLLTAIIRRFYASVFIHGTGGGVYDKVTEAWWSGWRQNTAGQDDADQLAPMAVATADLRLPFDLPSAKRSDVLKANQRVHHLKHNLNREPGLPVAASALADQKKQLLAHMHDDADAHRKHQSFKAIHAINEQLANLCPQVLDAANEQLAQAKAGLKNHANTMKRDWPFVIYSDAGLKHLADSIGL